VAGIAEECGFRGYMQKILEERYRGPAAITIASVVFGLIHLTHGFSVAILFDAAWGAVYGTLAYLTGSILPAVVLHSSLDALEFLLVWRFAGAPAPPLIKPDAPAWIALAAAAALSMIAVWSFARLSRLRNPQF
jgi:membrane protease YdiL (CAAX protease family)